MSNYTQSTNFATKDALPSGDPLKIVKGTEINTEFVNIAVAIATKADLTSPTLVTPALGTPSSGNLANCTFPTLNQNTTGTAANVTGTVAVANGGTGATSFTSGALLKGAGTSAVSTASAADIVGQIGSTAVTNATNATTAASCSGNAATVTTITTTQVANATAGVSVGAVGTYAMCRRVSGSGSLSAGSTVSGSELEYSSAFANSAGSSGVPSGTWRLMGYLETAGTAVGAISLFLRIS